MYTVDHRSKEWSTSETFPCHVNKIYNGVVAAIADVGFERTLERVTRSSSLYFFMLYITTN